VTSTDTVTILRSRGRRLAKTIHSDGTIEQYDRAKTFDLIEMPLAGLDALERLLRRLEHRGDCCAVRGAVADLTRTKRARRLLYRDRDDEPTLRDVPRQWLALDFDGLPNPGWIDPADLLGCACVGIRTLPNQFHRARFIVQATASHGLKPGIRIRLWSWLSRPTSGSELKVWLRSTPVDRSVFGPAQVIYTAAPIFLPGTFDPLTMRLDIIPGNEEVVVPTADRIEPHRRESDVRESKGYRDDVSGLVRAVAAAPAGKRNALLYWAACRVSENSDVDQERAGAFLEEAAMRAGLTEPEAAATVRSALRHRGG
jgi:hypothetical protein